MFFSVLFFQGFLPLDSDLLSIEIEALYKEVRFKLNIKNGDMMILRISMILVVMIMIIIMMMTIIAMIMTITIT